MKRHGFDNSRYKRGGSRTTQEYKDVRAMAFERSGGFCECGCGRKGEEPHHLFAEQQYPELVTELDNIVILSHKCHARHTSAFRRLPRYVARRAERLATTDSMVAYLDRYYDPRPLP